jgi:predicted RNA-binding Zn-ribbon protein involved in translation (DUF1610 family)
METQGFTHNADELRTLVDQYDGIQRQRIAASNRADAILGGEDHGDSDMYQGLADKMKDLEDEIAKGFKAEVDAHPVGPWLMAVRGIGPTMAAKVIGHIGDIERFDSASKLWRYAGYGLVPKCLTCDIFIPESEAGFDESCPDCGGTDFKMAAERRVRGHKLHYDPRFKTMLFNLGDGLIRSNSPYRRIYDEAYDYYLSNRPEWTKCQDCKTTVSQCKKPEKHGHADYRVRPGKGWSTGRVHLASKRKMVKIFLAHVFEAWRRIEGLPIQELYVFAVLNHKDRLRPEDFVVHRLPKPKWVNGKH